MRRRLLNLLTGLSLLLCVAVAVLWVRTGFRQDTLKFPDRRHSLFTMPHAIGSATTDRIYWGTGFYRSDNADRKFRAGFGPFFGYTSRPAPGGGSHAALGFVWSSWVQPPPSACGFTYIIVPLWAPMLFSSILPALWLRRRKHRRPGTCSACGYDLRATPDRCPECGMAATTPA